MICLPPDLATIDNFVINVDLYMLLLLDIISRDGQLLLRPIVVVLVVGIILCAVNGDDR